MKHLNIVSSATAQEKPRVFVQGTGSQEVTTLQGRWGSTSSTDAHDESMEVTKNLEKGCVGVTVTLYESNADYTVILNRESKHNRGVLRTNSQIQVANRLGDILGTSATRTVKNASKDACQWMLSDWSQHGGVSGQDSPEETANGQDTNPSPENESSRPVPGTAPSKDVSPVIVAARDISVPEPAANPTVDLQAEALIGVWFTGNPAVRHDGVKISGVKPEGPADNIDIKSGDVILAINAHYLFTIEEVRSELLRYKPGARLLMRYRRNQSISENDLILDAKDSILR